MQKTIFLLLFLMSLGGSSLYAQKIQEIYSFGGATGSSWPQDYVLLSGFTPGQSAVGMSLQYRGSSGTWSKTDLTGSADASGNYLYWCGTSCVGAPYTPQMCNGSWIMSNSGNGSLGTCMSVALMNNTTTITPSTCPSGSALLDLVGFLGTASGATNCCSETSPAPATPNANEARRRIQETNNNSVDFIVITNPFPVELMYFEVRKRSEKVELAWGTAVETNNDYFLVERSSDGVNYQSVGKVEGFGTSLERRNYTFTDENPLPGLAYYRLRQVDKDGAFEFSSVVSVLNRNEHILGVYPNPGKDWFTLSGLTPEAAMQVRVFDLMGRVVYEQNSVEGSNTLRLDLGNLKDGAYLIQVSGDEGYQQHLRIVKE
jgi:hypothetical protein